jgi:hypothetical protein
MQLHNEATCEFVSMSVYVSARVCVYTCKCVYGYLHLCVYVYAHVFVYVQVCTMCVYLHCRYALLSAALLRSATLCWSSFGDRYIAKLHCLLL